MRNLLKNLLLFTTILFLSVMVLSLFQQVVAREFKLNVDWTEELARFSFICMVFLASAYATLTNSHLRVSIFSDWLGSKIGIPIINLIHDMILFIFDIAVVWYATNNLINGIQFANSSPSLGFNQNYLFIFMIIGFLISAIIHFLNMIEFRKTDNFDVRQS